MSGEVEGAEEVLKELARLQHQYPQATAAALYEEGMAVMDASRPLVPVDTGRLRTTGYVAPPVGTDSDGPKVELGYGTNYALAVHEIPAPPATSQGGRSATHKVGQWKYLETPFRAALSGYAERLAGRIKGHVERGTQFAVLKPKDATAVASAARKAGKQRERTVIKDRARVAREKATGRLEDVAWWGT